MNSMTEARLLKEVLGKQAPVVFCQSSDDKKKYLATLKEGLVGLTSISLQSSRNYYPMAEKGTELCFSIEYPRNYQSQYYGTLSVCFDDQHVLCLTRGYPDTKYYFSGEIHQVESLVDLFLAEAEKRENKQLKAKKVKDLKVTAIMARIREIALADEFDYHYQLMSTKIKLVVRIEKNGFVEIDIPFGQFQGTLQRIRDCIRLAREIGNLKVARNIKYKGVQRDNWNWTSYRDSKN